MGKVNGRTVVVLSNIPWGFVWQRHQTIASLFAERNRTYFWEIPGLRRLRLADAPRLARMVGERIVPKGRETTGESIAGVKRLRPTLLPATSALFRLLNRPLIRRYAKQFLSDSGHVDVLWCYSVSGTAVEFVKQIPHEVLVYDCTDNWLAVEGIPNDVAGNEEYIMKRADLTIVTNEQLYEQKRDRARRVERIPHGVLLERFLLPARRRDRIENVRLVYYGHIYGQHLDVAMVNAIAEMCPSWSLTLVGPVKSRHRFCSNVEIAGQVAHERLRAYLSECDVIILPYRRNAYTDFVHPAKIYECLATGLPIVSTPIKFLAGAFQQVLRFGSTPADFKAEIEAALAQDTAEDRERRVRMAAANTWRARFLSIERLLSECLDRPQPTATFSEK